MSNKKYGDQDARLFTDEADHLLDSLDEAEGLDHCPDASIPSSKALVLDAQNFDVTRKRGALAGSDNSSVHPALVLLIIAILLSPLVLTEALRNFGKVPRLLELSDASLDSASVKEIDRCVEKLALAEEVDQIADSTNFGERKAVDAWKRPLQAEPLIIVLHETVIGERATVALFQTPHPNDADQVSYHMLIARDGTRLRIVPDDKRAYGAGMSAFGDVTLRTRPSSVGSVNNIALHLGLVTPEDGRDDRSGHSGYTQAQYRNLAAQVLLWQAKFGIPLTRLTTHEAIDRSHSRYDPRSFRWDRFDLEYRAAAGLCDFERFDNGTAGL